MPSGRSVKLGKSILSDGITHETTTQQLPAFNSSKSLSAFVVTPYVSSCDSYVLAEKIYFCHSGTTVRRSDPCVVLVRY